MAGRDGHSKAKTAAHNARVEYARMLDKLNQHLFGQKFETFKDKVRIIHEVAPKKLNTERASEIIVHLENKDVITFSPDEKKRNVDFKGLAECLMSDETADALKILYDAWDEINDILGLQKVEHHQIVVKPVQVSAHPLQVSKHPSQCTELSSYQADSTDDGGKEMHRKETDTSIAYASLKPLFTEKHPITEGIGLVRCHRDDGGQRIDNGTAFRVGSKYIMTAYHNFAVKIESLWSFIIDQIDSRFSGEINFSWSVIASALNVKEMDHVSIKKRLISDGLWYEGYRSVDILLVALDRIIGPTARSEFEKEIDQRFKNRCDIRFNYTEKHFAVVTRDNNAHQGNEEYVFSYNIPYGSKEHDVLVLELVHPDVNNSDVFPKRFKLNHIQHAGTGKGPSHFHVMGHPNEEVLQADLQCNLLKKDDELFIKEHRVEFWQNFTKRLRESDIEKGYKGCKSDENQLLFNVSKSTAHGASGAPCLIVDVHTPIVYVMLLGGFPKFFFNGLTKNEQESPDLNHKYLVEAGIPMSKVASLLKEKNLQRLYEDLFNDNVDEFTFGFK